MTDNTQRRLERLAAYHEGLALTIRKTIKILRDANEQTMPSKTRIVIDAPVVVRRPGPFVDTRKTASGKAKPGAGIANLLRHVIQENPGSTPDQLWTRIKGKFVTSSKEPRGLLNVELRRLLLNGEIKKFDKNRWSATGGLRVAK